MFDVNLLAVVAAAVASFVLGGLWYGPLFGKHWMKLVGMTEADAKKAQEKGMGKSYALMFLGSLVMAFVLSHVAMAFETASWQAGMAIGFYAWLGFIMTKSMGGVLWEGKSWNLYWFNGAYDLVNLLIMGLIVTRWI